MAVCIFDVFEFGGTIRDAEPWPRRKRLEGVGEAQDMAGVGLVPYSDDAAGLWDTWGGMGGEGIVLHAARHQPRHRPGTV